MKRNAKLIQRAVALLGIVGGAMTTGGCASEPGRAAGPGAFVANVGGGLVNLHDGIARSILGKNAGPMLIGGQPAQVAKPKTEANADSFAETAAGTAPASLPDANAVRTSPTADLDGDGFVTLDEIITLARSGMTDTEVIDRLERTQQIFDLTDEQERFLSVRGVSSDVIQRMHLMNRKFVEVAPPPQPRPEAPLPVSDRGGSAPDRYGVDPHDGRALSQ